LKIAIVVNPLIPVPPEQYGGIERIVYMLIQELMKNKHDITLYANGTSNPGCKLISYTESDSYNFVDLIKINLLTLKIAFQQYDLVHTFGRMSNIAFLMYSKIPKIVSYQLPPTISQVRKAVNIARNNSIFFTACSDYIGNQIKPYAKVSTIYNGVDLANYQFREIVNADAPLVFLGRIQKQKGTAIAIQVAKACNKRLIIAGNIPKEEQHRAYFSEEIKPYLDGESVEYIGPVNNLQKNKLLGEASAFLMPVTWDEPFGIVMAEALACGTPVIGFNRGAIPEVVVDGLNGFICDTFEDMTKAVHKVSTLDRNNCRRIASEKFSAGILAAQYERLYRQAMNGC
jgi:glycosyltransferase involved in cell wall biosynthesis